MMNDLKKKGHVKKTILQTGKKTQLKTKLKLKLTSAEKRKQCLKLKIQLD